MRPFQQILVLRKIFREFDKRILCFQQNTGLDCLRGCGWCCEHNDVETTVLEVMPLAWELWRRGQAVSWLKKAQEAQNQGTCVFYHPHPSTPGKGRCAVYPLRPLICRAFGFGCIPDKKGRPRLVTCAIIKNARRESYRTAGASINQGLTAVSLTDYTTRIICLDPAQGTARMPINAAIVRALERIGLQRQLKQKKRK